MWGLLMAGAPVGWRMEHGGKDEHPPERCSSPLCLWMPYSISYTRGGLRENPDFQMTISQPMQ